MVRVFGIVWYNYFQGLVRMIVLVQYDTQSQRRLRKEPFPICHSF